MKYCVRSYSWLEREKPWYSCPWDLLSIAYYHIVGGGANNKLVNEFTIEFTNKQVVAMPIEATTIGNLKSQMEL